MSTATADRGEAAPNDSSAGASEVSGETAPNASDARREALRRLLQARAGSVSAPARPQGEGPAAQPEATPASRLEPATQGQRALYFLQCREPGSAAYHIAFSARVRSALDVPALQRALQSLVDQHEALRTGFELGPDGELRQRVLAHCPLRLQPVDAIGCSDAELQARVEAAYRAPFDLARPPLLRASVFTCGVDDHVLLLTVHHLVHDAWSLWLLVDALSSRYAGECAGSRAQPAPAPTLAQHARWEAGMLAGPRGQELWDYWQQQLEGAPTVLDLPLDRPRGPQAQLQGAALPLPWAPGLTEALRQRARAEGVTPYMLLLAAWQVLLSRFSGQADLLVASPAACRRRPEAAGVIGYLANPLPMRARLDGNPTFRQLLQQTRQTVLDALAHEDLPLPLLVQRLALRRDAAHAPLVQVAFTLQKLQRADALAELWLPADAEQGADQRVQWAGLALQRFDLPQQLGQHDLELVMVEAAGAFHGQLKYDAALFDAARIEQLGRCLVELLQHAIEDPEQHVEQLRLLAPAEHAALCAAPAAVAAPFAVQCLHHGVEAQARLRPQAVAVRAGGASLTYAVLDQRAEAVARRLRARGVGPETIVGLCIDRTAEMIVGILGILKAGGAYLPLDPDAPPQRLAHIVADSRAPWVVTRRSLAGVLPDGAGASLLLLDDEAEEDTAASGGPVQVTPDHLAYVIYTSGSTGQPKGVQVTHANAARLFSSSIGWYRFDEHDVWSVFHSVAFDVSVWEIFGALLHGGCAVMVPHEATRAPAQLLQLLSEERVTILSQTPSAFRLLLQAEEHRPGSQPLHLRLVVFGGEQLDPPLLAPWFARHGDRRPLLVNMYGITETTVHSTYRPMSAADVHGGCSPIGVPLPDLSLRLLDRHGAPVPAGWPGEIHVGGPGVARGYLNRPELTAERFRDDPWQPGQRLYRSGDLARSLPGGDMAYLGRIDKQVKLRGFRIELGEIEAVLASHPAVREAVVALRTDGSGDKRLVAYTVPAAGQPPADAATLRAHAAERLPAYMLPSAWVTLPQLPLTHNGKLDHRALPEPPRAGSDTTGATAEAGSATEERLRALWKQALGAGSLGLHDNFFELGGHSLMSVSLMAAVELAFGRPLPVSVLFQYPTVARMAAWIDAGATHGGNTADDTAGNHGVDIDVGATDTSDAPATSALVTLRAGQPGTPPLFVVPGGGGNVLCFEPLARHLGGGQAVLGLPAHGVDGDRAPQAEVEALARAHVQALRRHAPQGPYRLAGHCFGALVAFEMARQLEAAGETVALLAVLDAPAPSDGPPVPAADNGAGASADEGTWLGRIASAVEEASGRSLDLPADTWTAEPAQRLRTLTAAMRRIGLLPPEAGERQLQALVEVTRASIAAQARYRPRGGITAPLVLLRAALPHPHYDYEAQLASQADRATLGWHRCTTRAVTVERVPGHHLSMLADPQAADMAACLSRYLADRC